MSRWTLQPAPRLKIKTMGRFEVTLQGESIPQTAWKGREPQRLLIALLSLGGIQVPKSKIINLLWPDADGNQAARRFEAAFHQLQSMLSGVRGQGPFLKFMDGTLRFDPACGWADICAFEEAVLQAREGEAKGARHEADRLLQLAMNLYGGEFLPEYSEEPWVIEKRRWVQAQYDWLGESLSNAALVSMRELVEQSIPFETKLLSLPEAEREPKRREKWMADLNYIIDQLSMNMTGEAHTELRSLRLFIKENNALPRETQACWIRTMEQTWDVHVLHGISAVGQAMLHLEGIRRELRKIIAAQENPSQNPSQKSKQGGKKPDRRAVLVSVSQSTPDFEIALRRRFRRVEPLPSRLFVELEITGGYYSALRGDMNSFCNVPTVFPPPPFIEVFRKAVFQENGVFICRGKNLFCEETRDILQFAGPADAVYEILINEFLSKQTGLLARSPLSLDTDLEVVLDWWRKPQSAKVITKNAIYRNKNLNRKRLPKPFVTVSNFPAEIRHQIMQTHIAHLRQPIRVKVVNPASKNKRALENRQ